jgi:hypothetical protein
MTVHLLIQHEVTTPHEAFDKGMHWLLRHLFCSKTKLGKSF